MHRSFFIFFFYFIFFNEAYLSMSMLMFICVWVTEALRGKWGIFFSGDALNCFLSGQYDSWENFSEIGEKKKKNFFSHFTYMKETNSPENCSSPVKMFLFFLSLSQTEKYFSIFLVSREKKKILWNSFVFVSLKKKSWKNVSLLPKFFFITNTWEKKTIFNFIIQFHAYGKKIWKNGNIYFTLTHEKKISWQIWFSGPNFTNEKENFSRFFFSHFHKRR